MCLQGFMSQITVFKNLRLKTINLLISGLLGIVGVCLALLLSFTIDNVRSIQTSWLEYQVDRSEKARLETVLRASIGYGGMIHNFKNYVLRHEDLLMDTVQADIGSAKTVIRQYQSLGTSAAEKVALEDIGNVLNNYATALFKTKELIQKETTPEEIDAQVKVNDTPALRGLQTLESEVERQTGSGTKDEPKIINTDKVRGRVAAHIRAAMGYGGMIHEFKNFVLRRDISRTQNITTKMAEIRSYIQAYRKLDPTEAEKISLDDISLTVNQYEKSLGKITSLISSKPGITATEIDHAVKVNDKVAFRGLATLDREIAAQVQALSLDLENNLDFLANTVPIINWIILSLIIIIVSGSIWIFNKMIVKPIGTTTQTMNLLAKDQIDIEISGTFKNNEIGQMARALEKFRDNIIERNEAEKKVLEMANSDALTGLDNRKRFEERIADAINFAKRNKSHVACLMIDLDKFKPVNDTYGHIAGDEVLKTIGERLSHITRETDFVARLGGDEFAVIATSIEGPESAELPANRILDQLGLPIYFEDNRLEIGGSIGIAIFPDDGATKEDLTRNADTALYAAKDAGRNCFRFFNTNPASIHKKPKLA